MTANILMQSAALPAQSGAADSGAAQVVAGAPITSAIPRKRNWETAMEEVRALPNSHDEWRDDERPPTHRVADLALAIMARLRPLIAPPPEVGASGGGDITLDWRLGNAPAAGYFGINVDDNLIVYGGRAADGAFFSGKCDSNNDSPAQLEQFARAQPIRE